MTPLTRLAAALLIVAVGVLSMQWLLRETLTRHHDVRSDRSLEVVFTGEQRAGDDHADATYAWGLVSLCHLEVRAELVAGSFTDLGDRTYRFVLQPTLDSADRRQLEGCLEDGRVDHFLGDVVSMEEAPAVPEEGAAAPT